MGRRRHVVSAVVGLVLLAGMALINELVFRAWFNTHYLRWYLDNGPLISILLGFLTLAWGDLNKRTELISAHPMEYLATCLKLTVLPLQAVAAILASARQTPHEESKLQQAMNELTRAHPHLAGTSELPPPPAPVSPEPEVGLTGLSMLDLILSAVFALAMLLASIAALLIVAPLQYFVWLVTAAPARAACASPKRVWFRITPARIGVVEAWKSDAIPEHGTESGFSAQPVALTAAVTAAALFVASKLIG